MLFTQNLEPFATGSINYDYQPVPPDMENLRLILRVAVEGIPTVAVVDTGAPYLVIAPPIAKQIDFDPNTSLGPVTLNIRGSRYQGFLYRTRVSLFSEAGDELAFSATAFVPNAEEEEDWIHRKLPSFLGLSLCLDRIRFAVDPSEDLFYFGALSQA